MRTLKFYGASDDLFEIEGTTKDEPDEIGCFNSPVTVWVGNEDEGIFITGMYAPNNSSSCWMIGISQMDEDMPLPDWEMSWGIGGRGYSVELTIEVPEGVVVSNYTNKGEY